MIGMSIWDIDMGYRYGISIWDIGHQWDIDRDIDMRYGLSIWDMVYRYGHSPYRYGHPGYRHRIWANDMGDDSIDMVILDIDMGHLVTLLSGRRTVVRLADAAHSGIAGDERCSAGGVDAVERPRCRVHKRQLDIAVDSSRRDAVKV